MYENKLDNVPVTRFIDINRKRAKRFRIQKFRKCENEYEYDKIVKIDLIEV